VNIKSLIIRITVAIIWGPLVVWLVYLGGLPFFFLTAGIIVISIWELYRMAKIKGAFFQLVPAELLGVGLVFAFYFNPELVPTILFLGISIAFFVEIYHKKGSPILNLSATLFGALFYGVMIGSFVLFRELPRVINVSYVEPGQWLLLLIFSTWVCDTAAYVFGSYFGKHKLMPRISPNKTVEGAVAGFFAAIAIAYVCHLWFVDELALQHSLVIGVIAGSLGQYGDLFESMLKRDADVKDSSQFLPGHGGIMDRFDSLSISAPLVYLYLRFIAF